MQNLVTAQEMKAADKRTSEQFGLDSLVLMERAALSAKEILSKQFPGADRFLFFCGAGNNGGDGLALARMLFLEQKQVEVVMVGESARCTPSCSRQLQTAKAYGVPVYTKEKLPEDVVLQEKVERAEIVVDALLGVGVNRLIGEPMDRVIRVINQRLIKTKCVSLDLPTGIHTDTGEILGTAVRADLTVTFAFQKLGLVRFPGCEFAGRVQLADAGITTESLTDPVHFTYTKREIREKIPQRAGSGNKGTFGKVLIIAGSHDMAGAALLCARGAYGVGVGMVKIVTCASNRVIVQTSLPEAMLLSYEAKDLKDAEEERKGEFDARLADSIQWADSIVIGPGLSTGETAEKLLERTIQHLKHSLTEKAATDKVFLLDADALNLISEKENLRRLLKQCNVPMVLTPHPGELARLTESPVQTLKADLEQGTGKLRQAFDKAVLVCKDARTYVFPDLQSGNSHIFVNTLGNDGMATAGSGDVLAGILGGICALAIRDKRSGENPAWCWETVCLGVAVHGAAGELAAGKFGKASMRAGDIADELPEVMGGGQRDESMIK